MIDLDNSKRKLLSLNSILGVTIFLVVTFFLFYLLSPNRIKTVERSQLLMGTLVKITGLGEDEEKIDRAVTRTFQEMRRVENLMSRFVPESEISLINKNAGVRWVKVDPEVEKVIRKAKEFSEITRGAFDISAGTLEDLWNFQEGSTVPSREEIGKLLKLVDYRKVKMDGEDSRVFLAEEGMKIDLGGIAKGFIVDRGLEALEQNGVTNAIINAGGDLTVRGSKQGKPWQVGIRDPRDRSKIFATLNLKNRSVATSGDYERYFIQEGIRFHHILDPRTGYPARGCRSVTIVAGDATTADALATAVFVMGAGKGIKLIETFSGVEGIIIDKEGKMILSSGLKDLIK